MTERHEWRWDEDVDGVQFLYCKRCPETIFPDEILSRLNEYETLKKATEVLSAEDATSAYEILAEFFKTGEHPIDGKPRDRKNTLGHRFGPGGLYAGQAGTLLFGHRFGDSTTGVPRGSSARAFPQTSRKTASDYSG